MKRLLARSNLSRLLSGIFFITAAIFVVFIIWREGSKIPWQTLQLNTGLVILSLIISTLGFIPAVVSWRMILRLYQVQNNLLDDLQTYIYAMVGTFVPGGIWQIVGRSMLYRRQEVSSLRVTSASILETILIALAGWLMYWMGLLIHPDLSFVKWPGFQYVIPLLILIFLEPHVLNNVNNWLIKKNIAAPSSDLMRISLRDIFILLIIETVTVVTGGVAVFVLLRSVFILSLSDMVNIMSAYGFSIAFASLFFWLPGRMVLKDSTMVLALTKSTPLSMAVIYVVLVRLWSIFTIVIPAGLLWLGLMVVQRVTRLNRPET